MADWNEKIIEEFRSNHGSVPSMGNTRRVVLLHHRGAKTGTERVNPVMSIRESDGAWLIAASAAGADHNPAWYHNLIAHPDVSIETPDDGVVEVRVDDLGQPARDTAWSRFKELQGFADYEKKTSRTIPVLRLTRR